MMTSKVETATHAHGPLPPVLLLIGAHNSDGIHNWVSDLDSDRLTQLCREPYVEQHDFPLFDVVQTDGAWLTQAVTTARGLVPFCLIYPYPQTAAHPTTTEYLLTGQGEGCLLVAGHLLPAPTGEFLKTNAKCASSANVFA